MISRCFEFPIPLSQFTPEKGAAQIKRMRACYAREWHIRYIMLSIMLGGFVLMLLVMGIAMVINHAS